MAPDAVLLIAYGGPARADEIRPFLDNVLRGRRVPRGRYEEVVRHYEEVGGGSPINRLTGELADRLRDRLRIDGPALPVYVGMRQWPPLISETLAAMARDGRRRAIGLVLAPHPSQASWDSYLEAVEGAQRDLGHQAPVVDYPGFWYEHPLFIEALAERASEAFDRLPAGRRAGAALLFTAHSIPIAMSEASGYAASVAATAQRVAGRLGTPSGWSVAWQSRSGPPAQPWLEPDILDALRAARAAGLSDVVVQPIGFVSDHVEVLYDLDIAARREAESLGLGFVRARTVGDHPAFVRMLAGLARGTSAVIVDHQR